MSGTVAQTYPSQIDEGRIEKPAGAGGRFSNNDEQTLDRTSDSRERSALFPETELGSFRQQWQNTQAEFVDDPRIAVRHADELVASVMKRLTEVFGSEREGLEHDWDRGEEVSTEDLRQVFRRYRSSLIVCCRSSRKKTACWRARLGKQRPYLQQFTEPRPQ